jgi:MATE family multidrug resistance protein
MLYSMLGATILFYPLYFLLVGHMGNHALWLAMIMFMAGRGIFQTVMAPRYISVD